MRKVILLCIAVCFMLVGCQKKVLTDDEQLKIVVASDLHYFLKDYYKDCGWFEENMLYGDGKMVTYADEIIDAFIVRMKEIKPHLVLLTGDLSFNGEKGSHEGLAKKLEQLKDDGIAVAVIPGNHDVDNIHSKGYGKEDYFDLENVNASSFKKIYKNLGYQNKGHQESLSYRIDINNQYSLLMLDTCAHELTGSLFDTGGYLSDATKEWTTKQLEDIRKNNKTPLIAMHHSLVSHNDILGSRYVIKDHEEVAKLFSQYQVPFVLSGHIHHQNIKEMNGIYDIASSSLLDAPLQYGVIDLNNEKMNYHCESLTISRDSNEYFDLVSSTHFDEGFQQIKDPKIREKMKDVVVKANRYYFTGNIASHRDEIMNMPGYKYYQDKDINISFYKEYLESMLKEKTNHQELTIDMK